MVHNRKWYKREGSALIMASLGFPDAETKWVYSAIIDMLNDRDRPLTDDAGFICGFTGLTRKKWAIARRYLLETMSASGEPFLILTNRGDLTNPRFEREHAERQRGHEEAVEYGREGGRKSAAMRAAGQGDLDLPPGDDEPPVHARAHGEPAKVARKSPRKSPESTPESHTNGAEKPPAASPNNNDLAEPPPQATRARKSLELREEDSSHPDSENEHRAENRLADADLKQLFDAVCDAAGYNPVSPAQIDRTFRIVEEWKKAGFDFDKVVIPAIRASIAESPDPTRTIGRFTARIRHEHARADANGRNGTNYRPPPSPVLEVGGEPKIMVEIRKALLQRLGPRAYAMLANDVRFEAVTDAGRGRKPLRVIDNRNPASRLMDGDRVTLMRNIAQAHGFTEVW